MRQRQRGAMRSVFWLLGLAAIAVALALLMGNNRSTVTLFWPPWRFDVSFNFFLFALIGGFVLVHAALRALSVLRELPVRAQRWRQQQLERAVVGSVLDALSNQLAGRFVRAQSAARTALDQLRTAPPGPWPRREQLHMLAHLLMAESAHSLRQPEQRETHLQAALAPALAQHAPEVAEGALLRAVRWAVEDRHLEAAQARLAELPHGAARRIQALRLRLRVARLGDATGEALETARLLAKHRAFSPEASASLVRGLALDALRSAHDLAQLERVWTGLDPAERQIPDLALAAAARGHELLAPRAEGDPGERARSLAMIDAWIEPLWARFDQLDPGQQRRFAHVAEQGLPALDAAGLARLEHHQRQWPQNPHLQYLAGQACLQRQLWGKATQLLGLARQGLQDATLLRRTWRSLARLAEERGDTEAAQAAWRQAAELD